ncbi:hypothetical protein NV379_04860 [Paenibacillus sp. N1-5-1-14]|uniref:hypothetical protein n=1 Tax=Paenibacillus radicibacter TaxID=2972488 RepID=UPI002158CF4C|nr:hypothetical protein [Paenibacillus radicibacter]MCR8641980.1 hypothetical protein [Paenibacillus radicibacter]
MEKILDFIFSNWIFVLIIISAVSSLWGKLSKSQETGEKSKPVKEMPSFGGGSGLPRKERDLYPEVNEHEDDDELQIDKRGQFAPATAAMDSDTVIRTRMVTRGHVEGPLDSYELLKPAAPMRVAKPAKLAGEKKNTGSVLSRKDMTQAIIWSEILGPPRSKKPNIR